MLRVIVTAIALLDSILSTRNGASAEHRAMLLRKNRKTQTVIPVHLGDDPGSTGR